MITIQLVIKKKNVYDAIKNIKLKEKRSKKISVKQHKSVDKPTMKTEYKKKSQI